MKGFQPLALNAISHFLSLGVTSKRAFSALIVALTSSPRGPIAAYKASRLESAQDLGADLIFGLHYYDFGGVQSDRPITPGELRQYGGILADTNVTIAMGGWKYTTQMWNQPGFPEALRYVRDLFASRDP